MVIDVNIINDVIEFAQRDSLIVIILAFSTLILAIVTTIALITTLKQTKKSNNELQKSNKITERMLELTHRPVLELTLMDILVNYKNDEWCSVGDMFEIGAQTKKFPIKFTFKLKNMGKESAQNIICSYDFDFITNFDEPFDLGKYKNYFSLSEIPKNVLKSELINLDLPAHHQEYHVIIDELEVSASSKAIFTLEISYLFLGDSEGYLQYIYEISENGRNILFRRHIS